jgi:hypothetical protein
MTWGVWRSHSGFGQQSGMAVNVPASAGLWTPAALDGTGEEAYAWFDANGGTYMTLSGSDITQMTDRSGNARHMSTTGGSFIDPTYSSNMVELERLATKSFDTWASALPAAAWDFFFIGDLDNTASTRSIISDAGGNNIYFVDSANEFKAWDGGTERSSGISWSGTGKRQALIRAKSNTDLEVGVDASAATTDFASYNGGIPTSPRVGNGSNAGQGFGGLHEWLFLPTGTSGTTKEKIEGYLAWKWDGILGGTTFVDAMPGGHSYKSAAPTL